MLPDQPITRRSFLAGTAAVPILVPCVMTSSALAREARSCASNRLALGVIGSGCKREWISLFDGKTLEGWHKNPRRIRHGSGGRWAVEDGTITGEQDPPGSGNGGILLTDQKFRDFELLIDMKPDWGVCSGLFLGHATGEATGSDFYTRTFDINGRYDKDRNLIGLKTAKHKSAQSVGLEYSCTPDEWVKAWKLND